MNWGLVGKCSFSWFQYCTALVFGVPDMEILRNNLASSSTCLSPALLFNTPVSNSSTQFQITSPYAWNIFYWTILHHIHKSPWHTHHEGSITWKCHHSLIALLALLMVPIFHVPLHHIVIFHIGIEKVSFPKTAFLPVISIFSLCFATPGGKGLWWIPRF